MVHKNAKQVVIIKDIESNFIEEAIFILKNNTSALRKQEKKAIIKSAPQNSDYIIKEAQSIIDNYIKQQSLKYGYAIGIPQENRNKKWNATVAMILNIAMFVSIVLFVYLLSRII